jgi:hypothetical protein
MTQKEATLYPSRHAIGASVRVTFDEGASIGGEVVGVSFVTGKVLYDVAIPADNPYPTRGVDSVFVKPE